MKKINIAFAAILLSACAAPTQQSDEPNTVTITVLGINDVHGEILPAENSGGLTTFSGYVQAVRAARANDGGAVLVIDAGDMWQGTLESNLVEGESVMAAYNAMQFTAATVGNHEFDFGPIGENSVPVNADDDPRGALKQRISEAEFPVLSANIVNSATGELVEWENLSPSVMVEAAGIKVGIVGLITANALAVTATSNTVGLEIAPLADAIVREASQLREDRRGHCHSHITRRRRMRTVRRPARHIDLQFARRNHSRCKCPAARAGRSHRCRPCACANGAHL